MFSKKAARYLSRERPDHTLQPTALIHEAYLKLIEQKEVEWESRTHFFGIAANLIRQILVDYARQKNRKKRSGEMQEFPFEEALMVDTSAYASLPREFSTFIYRLEARSFQ